MKYIIHITYRYMCMYNKHRIQGRLWHKLYSVEIPTVSWKSITENKQHEREKISFLTAFENEI